MMIKLQLLMKATIIYGTEVLGQMIGLLLTNQMIVFMFSIQVVMVEFTMDREWQH